MKLSLHLIVLLFFSIVLSANELTVTTYTPQNGLPTQVIYDAVQDKDGTMWFTTDKGLMSYDGVEWKIDSSFNQRFKNTDLRHLQKDENGNLWLSTFQNGGPILYKNSGNWFYYKSQTPKEVAIIDADIIVNKNDTSVALLTQNGKLFFSSSQSSNFVEIKTNQSHVHSAGLTKTTIYFSSDEGIFVYNINQKEIEKLLPTSRLKNVFYVKYFSDLNRYYFITQNSLGYTDGNTVVISKNNFETIPKTFKPFYCFLEVSDDGYTYFGSEFGAYRFNSISGNFEVISTETGYSTNGATSAFEDREQNIWITSLRGISKVRASAFKNFNRSKGLLSNEVTSIESFNNNELVLGHNDGFTFSKDSHFYKSRLTKNKIPGYHRVIRMQHSKRDDKIWFISQDIGFGFLNNKRETLWEIRSDQVKTTFDDFIITKEDTIIANNSNFFVYKNSKLIKLGEQKDFLSRQIRQYNDSTFISAGKDGVAIFNPTTKNFSIFHSQIGQYDNVYSLLKFNDLWLLGTLNGLAYFDGENIFKYEKFSIDKPIYFIERENEYIWFGLLGGAIRWNSTTNDYYYFTTKDGLLGEETNRDAFLYKNGLVYIGTDKGLSIFHPRINSRIKYRVPPKIKILSLQDPDGKKYIPSESIQLPYEKNDLTITYRGLSFIHERSLKYNLVFEDLESDSVETIVTNSPQYTFRNLEPGNYRIGVQVINERGVKSDLIYTADISVDSPFYLEDWFFALLIFSSVSLIIAFYDFMNKNRYSRNLEEEVQKRVYQLKNSEMNIRKLTRKLMSVQEEERQKISRELHDNVAQDITIVKMELEKFAQDSESFSKEKLDWLSKKLETLTRYIKNVSLYLHPDSIKQTGLINSLQALCNDVNKFSDKEIEFFSHISESIKLSEEYEVNIYRFVQEALTNIIKHSQAQSAIVILGEEDNLIKIRVEDDGIGFDRETIVNNANSKSMGLRSMEERILFMGGSLKIKSKPGEGTKLFAAIPIGGEVKS